MYLYIYTHAGARAHTQARVQKYTLKEATLHTCIKVRVCVKERVRACVCATPEHAPQPPRNCDMTHSCLWHDSFISTYVSLLVRMRRPTSERDIAEVYRTRLIHTWHDTYITWHASCQRPVHVTKLIHVCHKTPCYVWHDAVRCATWLLLLCDMTFSGVWHDSFWCVKWPGHAYCRPPAYTYTNTYTYKHVVRLLLVGLFLLYMYV